MWPSAGRDSKTLSVNGVNHLLVSLDWNETMYLSSSIFNLEAISFVVSYVVAL